MSIKRSIEYVVCKTYNNREKSYVIFEELISQITISLLYFVIFFEFSIHLNFREPIQKWHHKKPPPCIQKQNAHNFIMGKGRSHYYK